MKKRGKLGIALIVLVALLPAAGFFGSCRSVAGGLVEGQLTPCPERPSCVCSEELTPGRAIEPLAFEGDADAAFARLTEFVRSEPLVSIEEATPEYVHAVFATPIMRFRDDVEFRLDRERGVIHVRSCSRIGYSDMGANRKRVEKLRLRWNADG